QIPRVAGIDARHGEMKVIDHRPELRPDRDQQQQTHREAGQDPFGALDEAAMAACIAEAQTAPQRAAQVDRESGLPAAHAMPARKQSWMRTMPSGRLSSSTAKRLVIACWFMRPSASAASACGRMVFGCFVITASTVERSKSSAI